MTKFSGIQCDACGKQVFNDGKAQWYNQPSVFTASCAVDGINGGTWKMDVCAGCRRIIHDSIKTTVDQLRSHTHESQQLPTELQSAIEERQERG